MSDLKEKMKKIVDAKVKYNKTDFDFDKKFMAKEPQTKFIWFVSIGGTLIFKFWRKEEINKERKLMYLGQPCNRNQLLDYQLYELQSICRINTNEEFYIVDPLENSLKKITANDSIKLLMDHDEKIKKQWANE